MMFRRNVIEIQFTCYGVLDKKCSPCKAHQPHVIEAFSCVRTPISVPFQSGVRNYKFM